MSIVSESPDKSWSEERILELLKQNISGPSALQEVRLVCIDELRRRKTIKRVDDVMEVLLEVAKFRCRSTPESSLIVQLISRLANSEESAFQRLLNVMVSIQDDLLYCFARIVRNLEDEKKKICMPRLLHFLMSYGSFTNVTDEMYQTLVGVDNREIAKDTLKATLPYLKIADLFKVVYAVGIVSRLASTFIPQIELVVERALNGWYKAYREEILIDLCNYFRRIGDKRTIPYLLQILKAGFNRERVTSKALASVIDSNPKAITMIWEFSEKETKHYSPILMTFEEMKSSIDVGKLFSIVETHRDNLLRFSLPRRTLKNIVTKSGKQAKSLLLEMIKAKNQDRYTFALECLEEIGVFIKEYSQVFEKPPILQVYEFFYEKRQEMLLENIWKEQGKLRNHIKKHQRFEYFVQNLFSCLGFVTLFVDPSRREGVDLIAFAPTEPHILVIGCTTSTLKTDIKKLSMTLNEMKDALEELSAKHRILPMVLISRRVEVHPADSEFAGEKNIAILTQKETTTLLKMLRTNRRSREIIEYIKQQIPIVHAGAYEGE